MADEADKKEQQDVHDQKKQQKAREDEVKRARGLMSANSGRQDWEHRGNPERHPKSRQDDGRK